MLDSIVLVLLVLQSLLGVAALLRWRSAYKNRVGFPMRTVATHIAFADVTTVLWIVWMVTDALAWGWAALVTILLANGVGDLLLAGRWRLEHALTGRWLRGWVAAAKGLTSPRRRVNAAHAVMAGVTTAVLAAACVVAAT